MKKDYFKWFSRSSDVNALRRDDDARSRQGMETRATNAIELS